jgi:hypothetical protein
MNIQEFSDGQTEERIGERTDGGMALRTDGQMNGGSAASNSKKDVPAGGLTQKDTRAGSLTEGRKNSREEELESSISLFCGNEHATLVIFLLLCKGGEVFIIHDGSCHKEVQS